MSFDLPPLYQLPTYLIGVGQIGLGINTFRSPRGYYEIFGLPAPRIDSSGPQRLSSADKTHPAAASSTSSAVSPFVYVKAGRDLAFGAALIALQATGDESGINILLSTMFIAGAVEGWVVWKWGGEQFRSKAWGHWIGTFLGVPWVAWRVRNL